MLTIHVEFRDSIDNISFDTSHLSIRVYVILNKRRSIRRLTTPIVCCAPFQDDAVLQLQMFITDVTLSPELFESKVQDISQVIIEDICIRKNPPSPIVATIFQVCQTLAVFVPFHSVSFHSFLFARLFRSLARSLARSLPRSEKLNSDSRDSAQSLFTG